jgi:hypothetical protein
MHPSVQIYMHAHMYAYTGTSLSKCVQIAPKTTHIYNTLTHEYFTPKVLADLRAQKVQVTSGPPIQLFASTSACAEWSAMGLSDDTYYLESAAITLDSSAWPLLVDPGMSVRLICACIDVSVTVT